MLPDKAVSAFLHRKVMPYVDTTQVIAWIERKDDGGLSKLSILSVREAVKEFATDGAVPSFSYDYETGKPRCTDRFIAEGTLIPFADHVGEAYSALVGLPLFAAPGDDRI
jgi:hypothetical protein